MAINLTSILIPLKFILNFAIVCLLAIGLKSILSVKKEVGQVFMDLKAETGETFSALNDYVKSTLREKTERNNVYHEYKMKRDNNK